MKERGHTPEVCSAVTVNGWHRTSTATTAKQRHQSQGPYLHGNINKKYSHTQSLRTPQLPKPLHRQCNLATIPQCNTSNVVFPQHRRRHTHKHTAPPSYLGSIPVPIDKSPGCISVYFPKYGPISHIYNLAVWVWVGVWVWVWVWRLGLYALEIPRD